MREVKISMKELLSTQKAAPELQCNSKELEQDFVDDVLAEPIGCNSASSTIIPIDYVQAEQIIVSDISDVKGRLSDAVESLEAMHGVSVVPLEMANISSAVSKLQRHEIFELSGKRYAMSKVVREDIVRMYVDRIVNALSTGMPFVENLMVIITHNGMNYKTISLSREEWTAILSKFRMYKQALTIRDGSDLIMTIETEMIAQPFNGFAQAIT